MESLKVQATCDSEVSESLLEALSRNDVVADLLKNFQNETEGIESEFSRQYSIKRFGISLKFILFSYDHKGIAEANTVCGHLGWREKSLSGRRRHSFGMAKAANNEESQFPAYTF